MMKKLKILDKMKPVKRQKLSSKELEERRKKNRQRRKEKRKIFLWRYLKFFFITSFVITCSMILFFYFMLRAMNINLNINNIGVASVITFGNVMFLSVIYTVIDGMRLKIMVERPVKRILDATDKITQGDFSVRIKKTAAPDGDNFNKIIDNFNKMAEELSSVETLRTDFISNVSHELKTPLAVIQNYITMLQDTSLTEEEKKEYIGVIQTSARNLTELITNILKLNKLEKQQIYPEGRVYNLSEQVCECLLGFENVWEEKKIEIETEIEDDVTIKADEDFMSLVWNNLFSNAFKFTDEGGTVTVKVYTGNDKNKDSGKYISENRNSSKNGYKVQDGYKNQDGNNKEDSDNRRNVDQKSVYVSVSDTGCGMSQEMKEHIFEKFYQGDTSHATKGNGLGLALVKRVLDVMACDIEVESEKEKGSTFTVVIKNV